VDLTQLFRVNATDAAGTQLDNPSPPGSKLPAPIRKAVETVRKATKR